MESFVVDGQRFDLPLPQVAAGSRKASQSDLEYFQGFFDGDGCVSMNSSTGPDDPPRCLKTWTLRKFCCGFARPLVEVSAGRKVRQESTKHVYNGGLLEM